MFVELHNITDEMVSFARGLCQMVPHSIKSVDEALRNIWAANMESALQNDSASVLPRNSDKLNPTNSMGGNANGVMQKICLDKNLDFSNRPAASPLEPCPLQGGGATNATSSYSKEALTRAQDEARANPAYKPGFKGSTHCNEATDSILSAIYGEESKYTRSLRGDDGKPLLAREMGERLGARSDIWREITSAEAENLADNGAVVIAADHDGHVATLRPRGLKDDDIHNITSSGHDYGSAASNGTPLINQIGGTNGIMNANFAFSKAHPPKYYIPN